MHIPTNFCHVHKTKFTHTNKLSHIHHEHIHISLTQIFHNANTPQNPNQNSSNNITNYRHCQYSISHQHCPNCTMITKKITLQECSKAKIFKHDQSHNDPKFQNNQMTISHHATFNETCNKFFFPQARKPKKNSPWCLHDNMEHGS